MTTTTSRFRLTCLLFLGALAVSSGCGGSPAAADASQARETLITALEAWKNGDSPDALAARSPAIHVSDTDWKAGVVLKSYQAADSASPAGHDLSFSVVLELKGEKAKAPKKCSAVYVVTTYPQALVLRQETP